MKHTTRNESRVTDAEALDILEFGFGFDASSGGTPCPRCGGKGFIDVHLEPYYDEVEQQWYPGVEDEMDCPGCLGVGRI